MSAYAKSSAKTSIQAPKSASTPARMLRLFALYENLVTFTMPLCTALRDRPNPDTPISQSNNIVDISNVGLKQFWNLRGHMQDASTLATAHYPETLDRIFVIHSSPSSRLLLSPYKPYFHKLTKFLDNRRPLFLPHSLGLDKTLVRPHNHLQNLHPLLNRSASYPHQIHRARQHPSQVWRRTRLRLWQPPGLGPRALTPP